MRFLPKLGLDADTTMARSRPAFRLQQLHPKIHDLLRGSLSHNMICDTRTGTFRDFVSQMGIDLLAGIEYACDDSPWRGSGSRFLRLHQVTSRRSPSERSIGEHDGLQKTNSSPFNPTCTSLSLSFFLQTPHIAGKVQVVRAGRKVATRQKPINQVQCILFKARFVEGIQLQCEGNDID